MAVDMQSTSMRESVPEDDADDTVDPITDMTLVMTIHNAEQFFLVFSPDDPLGSWAALCCFGLNATESYLWACARAYGCVWINCV